MAGKYTNLTIRKVGSGDYQVWASGRNVHSKRLARFGRRGDAVAWIQSGKALRKLR